MRNPSRDGHGDARVFHKNCIVAFRNAIEKLFSEDRVYDACSKGLLDFGFEEQVERFGCIPKLHSIL